MHFAGARLLSLCLPEGPMVHSVMTLIAPLTPATAKTLRAAGLFDADGEPVKGVPDASISLKGKLIDCDLSIPSSDTEAENDTFRTAVIDGWAIKRKDEIFLSVKFKVTILGEKEAYDLMAFRVRTCEEGETSFDCTIRALQEEFDFTASGENDGTAVDMSTGDEAEDEPDEPEAEEPTLFEQAVDATSAEHDAEFPSNVHSIASAREMGVKRTRKRKQEPPTKEQVDEVAATVTVE